MHNIRPAGQMWPAEAFNLALKHKILFSLHVSLIKTPFECVKTYQFWPSDASKKIILPDMRFELCTPDLKCYFKPKFVQKPSISEWKMRKDNEYRILLRFKKLCVICPVWLSLLFLLFFRHPVVHIAFRWRTLIVIPRHSPLVPGANFINTLWAASAQTDSKSAKKDWQYDCLFFALSGSARTEASSKMMMKLTLGGFPNFAKRLSPRATCILKWFCYSYHFIFLPNCFWFVNEVIFSCFNSQGEKLYPES